MASKDKGQIAKILDGAVAKVTSSRFVKKVELSVGRLLVEALGEALDDFEKNEFTEGEPEEPKPEPATGGGRPV